MKKNLPIKLFKKRNNDKALNNLPVIKKDEIGIRFRLEGEELNARLSHFNGYFGGLRGRVQHKVDSNNYLPTIVKLKLNNNALSKTYRGEIGKIFNRGKKINLIGMASEDELLVKIDDINDLDEIEKRIKDTDKNIVGISVVEEALDFSPVIDLENNEEEDLKVKLINYGDYKLNEIAQRSFENLCNSIGLKYTKLNYTKDLILYRVSSVKPQSLINANESESIFSITKVPVIRLTKNSLIEEDEIKAKSPEKGVDYFKIGIFDEGISDISHLKEWKDGSYIAFGKDEYNNDHGTFVAGIINYGDQLEGKDWTGTKPFKITEAVIYPNN